ncbi:DNA replication complex GINS protein psf2 [Apodospora peruviana]|uniref:DNA replication complex GINS protein PSF2 n=1 Tax=Apodospora peruviana TaxID=516989 RepID=A0AAE0MH49_9PEZI|nr:DNA replication complex GINS protein psf2 [Apodospora peruviana]
MTRCATWRPKRKLNLLRSIIRFSPRLSSPVQSQDSAALIRRANIVTPPWLLHPVSLSSIINRETKEDPVAFSPPPPPPSRAIPFRTRHRPALGREQRGCKPRPAVPALLHRRRAGRISTITLARGSRGAARRDDMPAPAGEVRSLMRDLVEVRAAKLRSSTSAFEGFGDGLMSLTGVGAMELAESRGFVLGVVDGVGKIGASAEATRREGEEAGGRRDDDEESDEDMGI